MLPADLTESRRRTSRLAKSHYENFLVSSILLPKPMRQPFYDVYAFCRTADDAADESPSTAMACEKLSRLREELAAMFKGDARSALFVALHQTVCELNLPQGPFDDLIDAFEQDQSKVRYENDEQLLNYCRRSANPVGRIVLAMAGADDEDNVNKSDRICTGLQLINFWQDIARDFSIGRVYVPAERMRNHGVSENDLDQSRSNEHVLAMVRQLNQWAKEHFSPAEDLADSVPDWLSPSIRLFAGGGLATCDAIERAGFEVLQRRPVVRRRTQAAMILRTFAERKLLFRKWSPSKILRRR